MPTTIIGIDCATQPKNVGLVLGRWDQDIVSVDQVLIGSMVESIVDNIAAWATTNALTLLALDAPLGWPAGLGEYLQQHQAGASIRLDANSLFRRNTDRFVKQTTGKLPLDVGADRIARTAHAALGLLQDLRERSGQPIPLAWQPELSPGIQAIEVYPAGTLAAYGIDARGYKKREGRAQRRALLRFLDQRLSLPQDRALMEDNDDALDAALCVLAGLDFLRGRAMEPKDLQRARKEGWIWVKG